MASITHWPVYHAPGWLVGPHVQTIYPAWFGRPAQIDYGRERWATTPHGKPDGDFIDVDRVATTVGAHNQPMVVQFHGLEGSSQSPYARNVMAEAARRGWRGIVPHFRGCSGVPNRLPRAYHSGDSTEIDWILRRIKAEAPEQPLYVAAVSLGGNAVLKWLGEQGEAAGKIVNAVVAISAPLDLMASGAALEAGFCKLYTKNFLLSMKQKSLAKLAHFPDAYDGKQVRQARTLREFDNVVTAPLHGYKDTDDYWTRASSKPGLVDIRVPTLLLNARNDPFLPAAALPRETEVSRQVTLDFPAQGGHAGFLSAPFPGNGKWLPQRIFHFFDQGS